MTTNYDVWCQLPEGGVLMQLVYRNRIVHWNYVIEETFECGIVLTGTEIKSVRNNGLSMKEAWCDIENNQLVIKQMHISEYSKGNRFNVDEKRVRVLLVHKNQIRYMLSKIKTNGYTLVPVMAYFKGSKLKIEVGIAKGRKKFDKRLLEAERDAEREIERFFKTN